MKNANFDTYERNGIMETNEGASKCNPSDPQTSTATWTWTNNETKIIFDNYDEYVLDELTATTLKLRQTFVENGVTYCAPLLSKLWTLDSKESL